MDTALSILVVDENGARAAIIEDGLREAGYCNVAIVAETLGLMRRIETLGPDVIIMDLGNRNRDQLEEFFQVSRSVRRPVAMFVDCSDRDSIEAAIEAGVSAYIVDGLRKERVKPILDMAVLRFRAFERLSSDLRTARSELDERKVIDKAKKLLMQSQKIAENEAYKQMRRRAMNENLRIVEIARRLLDASSRSNEASR